MPVFCDKLVVTENSGLYLVGAALVKSASGQEVSSEELGGSDARRHQWYDRLWRADDPAAIARVKQLERARRQDLQVDSTQRRPLIRSHPSSQSSLFISKLLNETVIEPTSHPHRRSAPNLL